MGPERRLYEVDDWTIHARVATGGRVPVVLVHGLAVSSRYMVPLVQVLAPDFDVYAPDLPGSGRSTKPREAIDLSSLARCLEAFLDAAGLHHAVFVGNSFGCQVLAELALRAPVKVLGLVLQGPTIDPHARSWSRQVVRWVADGPREPQGIRLGLTLLRDYLDCGPRRA
ncbi:MAG: alpha/beta hydrolase, partial [Actinomycetota bacterium]|nr:alpha/beta hydrolase [Actinomycetota bacterium]